MSTATDLPQEGTRFPPSRFKSDSEAQRTNPFLPPQPQGQAPPTVQEPFAWPQATFISELVARAPRGRTSLEKEEWTKEVKRAMDAYFLMADQLYIQHMGNQGRMDEYIAGQAIKAGGLDDKAKLAMFDKSVDLTDNRTPQVLAKQDQFLDPYLKSADQGLAKEASRIKAYRDERVQFSQMAERDVEGVSRVVAKAVKDEKEAWFTRGGLLSAMEAPTLGPIAGNPQERILARIGDAANRMAEDWRHQHERSPNKDRFGDPETYRRHLRATGLGLVAKDINDPDLEESFLAGATRYLGGIATPMLGAKALQAAAGLVKAAPKLKKLLTVGTAGGFGLAIAAHGPDEAQRVAIEAQSDKEKWTPEQREKAMTAASILNGAMGATFLPVFSAAMGIKAASPSWVTRTVAPAAGLTAAGEVHTKAMDWMRGLAESIAEDDSELQKQLDMMNLTNPKVAGPIQRLVTGAGAVEGQPGDRWQAAKDVAQQLIPNMVFFGAIQAVRAAAPEMQKSILKREHVEQAKSDVYKHLSGEAKDMALKDLDELKAQLPEPTATEKLAKKVGPEKASEEIRTEMERERRMKAAEPAGRAAEDAERAEALRVEAQERRMRGEEPVARAAEDEEIRLRKEPQLSPEQEDASAYRQMAEKAAGGESVALRDLARMKERSSEALAAGREPLPTKEGLAKAAEVRDETALAEAVEAPKQEEAAAKTLLEGGLERQELQARADKLDQIVGEELAQPSGMDKLQERRLLQEGLMSKRGDLSENDPAFIFVPGESEKQRVVSVRHQADESALVTVEGGRQVVVDNRGNITLADSVANLSEVVKPGDIINTLNGEIVVESVKPGLIQARDEEGALVSRTPSGLAQETPKLVGRRRKMAEKLAAQRQAEKAAKESSAEEDRWSRIEKAAHKAQHGTPEEKATAKKRMVDEVVANDADVAQKDYEARKAKAAEVDAPPPGEDEVPAEALKGVSFAKRVQETGILGRLAESTDWSSLKATKADNAESRSLLETAKQRGQVYPKDLTGEERAAQVVFDHLRISEGLPPAAETVKAHIGYLNRDLKRLEKMKGADLWRGLQAVFERHHDFIKGPWASVSRMTTDGLASINRLEDAIKRAGVQMIAKPGERGAVLTPGSKDVTEAGRLIKLLRSTWPWSTQHGLNPNLFSLSSRVHMDLVSEITKNFDRDPALDLAGQPWLERFMQGMGLAFGAPEVKFGRIGIEASKMFSYIQDQTIKHLRDLVDTERGLMTGLTMEQRRVLFDVGEADQKKWAQMTTDPIVLERAPRWRALNEHFKKILWDESPVKFHLENDIRVMRAQLARASEGQAMASKEGQFLADQRFRKANERLRTAEAALEREQKQWAVKNFVHHVAAGKLMTGGDFTIMYHRQSQEDLAKKGFEPVHDALASAVDYGPKAIAVAAKNRFNRRSYEFLQGQLRMAEWKDIAGSNPDAPTRAIHDGEHVEILGEHYVLEGAGGKRQLFPVRKKVGSEWADLPVPEGAKRMVVLAPWDGTATRIVDYYKLTDASGEVTTLPTGKFAGGKFVEAPKPEGAERVTYRQAKGMEGRYRGKGKDDSSKWKLLHANEAMVELSIRDGGWVDRASPKMAADMDQFLEKAYRGIDELRLNQSPAKGIIAAAGRWSSKMAMTSPGTAVNIAVGGSLMNTLHMDVTTQTKATEQLFFKLIPRRLKGLGETLPGAEPGTPDYDVGRGSLRTSSEKLAKMKPADAVDQGYWDDGMVDLSNSGLLEHTMVDLEKKLKIPTGKDLSEEAVRGALGKTFSDKMLLHVRGADAFARVQNYLGVNFQSRKAGMNREQAHAKAATSVIFNHGQFNALTQSPLLASTFGQFFLGLKTYLARQFMVWAAAPADYKVKYASLVIATNYMWQQMGLGDLTSALGTSFYDLPFAEDYLADLFLSSDEPLGPDTIVRPGLVPVHTPFSSSPMIGAVETALQAVKAGWQGNMEKLKSLSARAIDQAFVPALFKMVNKMMAEPNAEGTYDAISIPQRVAGDERTSYTLKQTGIHQGLLDLVAGTQADVQQSVEKTRIAEAQKRARDAARLGVRSEVRGLLRRHDEAEEAGALTPTQVAESESKFKGIASKGKELGINLEDTDVRKQVFREERKNILIDRLPPELRAIARDSKEGAVRQLTDALNGGLSMQRLQTLRAVLAPGKSLRTWGLDAEHVSESTAKKFVAAIERWSAKQEAAASTPRAVAR